MFKFFIHIMLILFLLILHKSTKLQKTRNAVWLILFDSEKHAKTQKLLGTRCVFDKNCWKWQAGNSVFVTNLQCFLQLVCLYYISVCFINWQEDMP